MQIEKRKNQTPIKIQKQAIRSLKITLLEGVGNRRLNQERRGEIG
jgi:hypothetical protein